MKSVNSKCKTAAMGTIVIVAGAASEMAGHSPGLSASAVTAGI